MITLSRRLTAEALGTALLLSIIVGSGIMGARLSGGNIAIALLANALATGTGLIVLILVFGPLSGAHFNPVVTLADAWQGGLPWREVPAYLIAQVAGAFAGVVIAHAMFNLPLVEASTHIRSGTPLWISEFIATFGLLAVIRMCSQHHQRATPYAIGAYITSAYWFTSSTAFANPAVTLARAATETFAGIRLADTPGFIVAQLLGTVTATALFAWLLRQPDAKTVPSRVIAAGMTRNAQG
jgi:glycerol uptake facilitator-like aquaporin